MMVQPWGRVRRLQDREIGMRSLLKPTLAVRMTENPAGLLVDLAILAAFVVLLAFR
jgi:hypothetical protein